MCGISRCHKCTSHTQHADKPAHRHKGLGRNFKTKFGYRRTIHRENGNWGLKSGSFRQNREGWQVCGKSPDKNVWKPGDTLLLAYNSTPDLASTIRTRLLIQTFLTMSEISAFSVNEIPCNDEWHIISDRLRLGLPGGSYRKNA